MSLQDMKENPNQLEETADQIEQAIEQAEPMASIPLDEPPKKKFRMPKLPHLPRMGKKGKRILAAVLALAVLGSGSFAFYQKFMKKEEVQIATGTAFIGNISKSCRGVGTAVAKNSKDVTTSATGKVLHVYVKDGDVVQAGDPLFAIDTSAFTQQLQDKLDQLNERQQDINKIQESINNLTVKAPFTGKIIGVDARVGDMASDKIGTMYDDSVMKLTLYYSHAYLDTIKKGQKVTVSIPQSMASVEGWVEEIHKINRITEQGTVLFEVDVKMNNPGTLTKDMDATAVVHTPDGDVMPAESGKLEYNQEQDVRPKSSGEIVQMNAKDYYEFKAGQTLCVLKDDSLNTQLVSAREAYNNIKKDYDKLMEDKQNYESFAPISGTVTSVQITEGEELTGSGQVAVSIADLNEMVMDINIDEININDVQVGMQAILTTASDDYYGGMGGGMMGPTMVDDSMPEEGMETEATGPMTGTVTSISMQGKAENGVTTFPGTIAIDNPQGLRGINMNLNYTIMISQKDNVLLIPVAGAVNTNVGWVAYVRKEMLDGREPVELPTEQQQEGFVPVAIEVGESDGTNIEIISGLNEGDEVALLGTAANNNDMYGGGMVVYG